MTSPTTTQGSEFDSNSCLVTNSRLGHLQARACEYLDLENTLPKSRSELDDALKSVFSTHVYLTLTNCPNRDLRFSRTYTKSNT